MMGRLANNSRTTFVQQGEINDEEFPPAPASLPSVPSFGEEEWSRFNALTDTSTTSASPISPNFSGFGSSSSMGVARSYATTPLSSASNEIPRSVWPLLFETSSQVQLAELNHNKHAKFILEDPTMTKHKKDKAMRACTPCFTKRLECCETETPNRCTHCIGKTSYCKGPIETPRLLDLERIDAMIAALLGYYHQFKGLHLEPEHLGAMQVDLSLEPPFEQDVVSNSQAHRLQLPALRDDFHFIWDSSNLDDVLDTILLVDVPLCIAPKSGLYDLSSYEGLCRRFCACISLLRRPNECTLDKMCTTDHKDVRIVLGFLFQLARTASSTFSEIFEHVRACCFATRDRRGTPNLMFTLAKHLGLMHTEIRLLMEVEGQYSDSLPLSGLLLNASQNLNELSSLGMGLCSKAFESTYQLPALDITGINLMPCFESRFCSSTDDNYTSSQHASFLDILRDLTPRQYPGDDQPVPIIYTDENSGAWQSVDVEGSNLLVGHELQKDTGNGQDTIFGDHLAFGVKGLQTEANAIFNPEWTLRLDGIAATHGKGATVGTDHFYAGTLNSIPHGQHADWAAQSSAVQQASFVYFQDTSPEYTDLGSGVLTSLHDEVGPSQTQPISTHYLETANSSALSDITKPLFSLPAPILLETPKRASKRKRIKTALSRKKPCLKPLYHTHNGDPSASKTDLSSKLTLRTGSAKKKTIDGKMSTKQPSYDRLTKHSRVDWKPGWEQGRNVDIENEGIFKDIEISDSERRPMSWPHRSPWRKSLDISVAVLTKGFEKMMTEKGESSPSAV